MSDDFAQGHTVVTQAPIKVEIDFKNEDVVTNNVSLTSKWGIFHLWLLVSRRSGSRMFVIFENRRDKLSREVRTGKFTLY